MMSMYRNFATIGAVAAFGLGMGAAGASAYSISGGAYTAVSGADSSSTIGGAYTATCSTPTFAGTATGSATTSFTPSYETCEYNGFPADFTVSGAWDLTVVAGPDGSGWYSARVDIPAGSTVTVNIPIVGCTVVNSGLQSFAHGTSGNIIRLRNVLGGVEADATVNAITYTATGCPFSSGSDGTYSTNGTVRFPGITIS